MKFVPTAYRLLFVATTVAAAAVAFAGDAPEPIQQPIPDLPLTNGRVLHNATIIRYAEKWVVLKTSGGTGPVNYTMIAEPLRGRMIAERDAQVAKEHAPVIVGVAEATKVTGRAVSGEGEHLYRFRGIQVGFIPRTFALKKINPTLGTHETFDHFAVVATANERGEFEADVPPGEYIAYAAAVRRYPNRNLVRYEWVVEVSVGDKPVELLLNDENAKYAIDPPKPKKKE
jgi:hypothetical protein